MGGNREEDGVSGKLCFGLEACDGDGRSHRRLDG